MKRLLFYSLLTVIVSCSSQSKFSFRNIQKGHDKTEKTIRNLTKADHRVFFFYSTYALDSYVWTYNRDVMKLYIINNSRIDTLSIRNEGKLDLKSVDNFNGSDHIYPYALDGDIIGVSELDELNSINIRKIPIDGKLFVDIEFPFNYELARQLQTDLLLISGFLGKEIY